MSSTSLTRKMKTVLLVACTAACGSVFGTSCGTQMRDAVVDGVAGFVGGATTTVLDAAVPIDEWANPE